MNETIWFCGSTLLYIRLAVGRFQVGDADRRQLIGQLPLLSAEAALGAALALRRMIRRNHPCGETLHRPLSRANDLSGFVARDLSGCKLRSQRGAKGETDRAATGDSEDEIQRGV